MRFLKKSLSLLLVLCMLLSVLPMGVLADGTSNDYYKIVQLDCGRKYWSVGIIFNLIDKMAEAGYNQLGLYFSDNQGFRFALNDMTVSANGTTYDLSKALGNGIYQSSNGKVTTDASNAFFRPSLEPDGSNWLIQADMDRIIEYANKRGIEIVPSFDMPGHMGAILDAFSQFKYGSSSSTFDVTNDAARAFVLAILQKYVTYFSGKGCKYFNICADEFCYDIGMKTADAIADATLCNKVVSFMDEAAKIIVSNGMTPRAFSDFLYADSSYSYSDAYKKYEVIFWDKVTNLSTVVHNGNKIINCSEDFYYVANNGGSWYNSNTAEEITSDFKPDVLSTQAGAAYKFSDYGATSSGAMFCIWCDQGYLASEPSDGDAGAAVLAQATPRIKAFAAVLNKDTSSGDSGTGGTPGSGDSGTGGTPGSSNPGSGDNSGTDPNPDPNTHYLTLGEEGQDTWSITGLPGRLSATDFTFSESGIVTVSVEPVEGAPVGGGTTVSKVDTLTNGTYLIGDGTNFLSVVDGGLANSTDPATATRWTINASGDGYTIAVNNQYLKFAAQLPNYQPNELALSNEPDVWLYDANGLYHTYTWGTVGKAYLCIYTSYWTTWGSPATDGYPYTVESTAGTPTYTTNATFTAAAVGTTKVTLDGVEHTFVVSAPHEHVYDIPATCISPAKCSCGATEPNGAVDPSNHVGGTKVVGFVAATIASGGYSGDTHCAGCNAILEKGHSTEKLTEAAKTENVNVATGAEKVITINDVNYTGAVDQTNLNTSIATVTVEHFAASEGGDLGGTAKESLADGDTIVIGNGTKWLTLSADGVLGTSETVTNAAQWTAVAQSGTYRLRCGDYYLYGNNSENDKSLVISKDAADDTNTRWIIEAGVLKEAWYPSDYINLDTLSGSSSSSDVGAYAVSSATPERTVITINGITVGNTEVVVGDTKYLIHVLAEDLSNISLTVDYRITNFTVTGDQSHQTSMVIQAADVYGEDGAALANLVDRTGTWQWVAQNGYVVYWKGVYLEGKTQSGDGTGTDQSLRGVDFQWIRYYDGNWACRNNTTDVWQTIDTNEAYQLVAYYLNHTEVTKEIETRVVDWGYTPGNNFDGVMGTEGIDLRDGFALLDYDVRYPSGVRNPAEFPNKNTFSFHTLDGTHGNQQVVSRGNDSMRRVGMSLGVNSSNYEVYMITVTRSNDEITQKLGAKPSDVGKATNIGGAAETDLFKGKEYVAWSLEPMTDADFENLGMPKVPGLNGAAEQNENNIAYTDPGGAELWNAWHNAVATDYHYGGDPYVAAVYIGENQGLRITFWVREKVTEEKTTLKVNYHDISGGDFIFHSYSILPDASVSTFPNNISYDEQNRKLVNATVRNSYGVDETVQADLTKMLGLIPNSYVTGLYDWVRFELSEDRKTLDLYYQKEAGKVFVVDFGLPIDVTLGDLGLANVKTFNSFALDRADGKYEYGDVTFVTMDGEYDSGKDAVVFTYTPKTVIKGTEHVVLNFGYEDGTKQAMDVYILPATTVYYEEGFADYTGNSWTVGAKNGIGKQQTAQPGQNNAYNYGYDSIYAGGTSASNNTAAVATDIGDKAIFSFVGTGVDVNVNTTTDSGFAMVTVKDSGGSVVKAAMVDTHMESGEGALAANQDVNGYNEPIVSLTGLTWGSYSVELRHVRLNNNANPISFDGFRIYNTMGTKADSFYRQDAEAGPDFVELRDCALFTAKVSVNKGDTVYAEQIANSIHKQVYDANTGSGGKPTVVLIQDGENVDSNTATEVKQDLLDNGPKNEVYLYGNNTLVIAIPEGYDAQIGLKNLSGSDITAKINGTEVSGLSSTEMYFKLTGGNNNNHIISVSASDGSVTTSILALTKLKLIRTTDLTVEEAELLPESLTTAVAAMGYSRQPVEETPDEPGVSGPENSDPEPVDPEPADPEPADPEPADPEPVDPEPTEAEDTKPEDTYDASKIYRKGDTVVYNGKTYKAKWWTKGENPETAQVWELVSTGEDTDSTAVEPWSASKIYTAGMQVSYNGHIYEARWWTYGKAPSDSKWSAWKLIS